MYIDLPVRTEQPLFAKLREIASCERCLDSGLWFEPQGNLITCPRIQIGLPHAELNAAARSIHRSIAILRFNKIAINHLHFDIARTLAFYTTTNPCPRKQLIERNFAWATNGLRKLHSTIEELRSTWRLPVGSRRDEPSGYWIITDEADFRSWVDRAKASPITQLSTICRVAKANWPVFAEQLELEFWNDLKTD